MSGIPVDDLIRETLRAAVRGVGGGPGQGFGGPRNRGVPGYPVPPEMEAPNGSEEPERGFDVLESAGHTGTFLGLKIPVAQAKQIIASCSAAGLKNCESPEDLHITLFYRKGIPRKLARRVREVFEKIWQEYAPLKFRVERLGRFTASESSDGKDVIWAAVDDRRVFGLRERLVSELKKIGIEPDPTFKDYKAHITIKYVDPGEVGPQTIDPVDIEIISCVFDPGAGVLSEGVHFEDSDVKSEAMSSKSIPHLDQLNPAQLESFIKALEAGKIEVSEKIDGSCRLTFGVKSGRVWTETKYGARMFCSADYGQTSMYEAARAAHEALESKASELIRLLPENASLTAEVLYGPVPNVLEYGPNAIVVHGHRGIAESKVRQVIERVGNPDGWIFEYKRAFTPGPVRVRRETLYRDLLEIVKSSTSRYGPQIEGLVFRNKIDESLVKVVDRETFTRLNSFMWSWRELIDRGMKIKGIWQPGVMQELRTYLADEVLGLPVAKTPGFVNYLVRMGHDRFTENTRTPQQNADEILELVLRYAAHPRADFVSNAASAVDHALQKLESLQGSWICDSVQRSSLIIGDKKYRMHPAIKERTDRAFAAARRELEEMKSQVERIASMISPNAQRAALLKLLMGHRYAKLCERLSPPNVLTESAETSTIAVTIGRFQPFHRGHAKMIRDLAREFTNVVVFVAGLKKDADNPFSLQLREQMMEASLQDVWSKIEIYPAQINGTNSGYLPGLIDHAAMHGSVIKEVDSVVIRVGQDRAAAIQKQITNNDGHRGEEGFYQGQITLQVMPDVTEDGGRDRISGTQVRRAIMDNDVTRLKALLDPLIVGDPARFSDIYGRMRAELGLNAVVEGFVNEFFGNDTGVGNSFTGGWGSSGWSRPWLAADEADAEAIYTQVAHPSRMVPIVHDSGVNNLPGVDPLTGQTTDHQQRHSTDLDDEIDEAIAKTLKVVDEAKRKTPVAPVDGKKRKGSVQRSAQKGRKRGAKGSC